jgi:hypothetical protein
VTFEAANGDANLDDNIDVAVAQVVGETGSFAGIVFDEAGAMPPAHTSVLPA